MSFGYDLSEEQEENKALLNSALKDSNPIFHSVSNQTVIEGINKFIQKNQVNFLIMINNEHTFLEKLFFKSKVKQLGFHVKVPFLVIPAYSK